VCVFFVKEDVANVAMPLVVVPVPIDVVPSKNVTSSPFGTEPYVHFTFAVNVTDCPTLEGDPDVVNFVVVGARPMYSVSVADVLVSLDVSPE
jgi:hypothetical protein